MFASIVIPLYNRWDLTEPCLDAIQANTAGAFELVLVDNGSTDETSRQAVQVRNQRNRGFAIACNQGALYASGDVVVFLNNDTEPQPGWLPPLLASGVNGSRLIYPDGALQHAGIDVDFSRPPGGEAWNRLQHDPSSQPVAVTGACMAMPRETFIALGGFDDGFWNGYEDVDLCLTARANGVPVTYHDSSVVMHHESQSGDERWRRVAANVNRLRAKWGDQ